MDPEAASHEVFEIRQRLREIEAEFTQVGGRPSHRQLELAKEEHDLKDRLGDLQESLAGGPFDPRDQPAPKPMPDQRPVV